MARPDIYQRTLIDVLDPKVKREITEYALMQMFRTYGCTRDDDFAGEGKIPLAPMRRVSVFKTDEQKGTYNHHANLIRWKDRYWYFWDNCRQHEEYPGQRTLVATSDDLEHWSEPITVAPGDEATGMLRNLCGVYVWNNRLFAIIQEKWDLTHARTPINLEGKGLRHRQAPEGLAVHDNPNISYRLDIWETSNGYDWQQHEGLLDIMWMMEKPRLTREGRLLGAATKHDLCPAVVLWPGANPLDSPEIIDIPYHANLSNYFAGRDEGLFYYGEGSWYQDDEGRIWMWQRDESLCGYLGVCLSEDGGRSWTEIMRTDFPDVTARVYAGRLKDGRFYIVGNSVRIPMHRNFFAISLSEDGAKFNKLYQLIGERTTQRFAGHLKVHGWQYPSCIEEENRLLIAYSVNKEDMEIGILDTRGL